MDVRQYYKKLNEIEAGLTDKYPVVVSLETSDGGRAGMISEVSRNIAAKLLVEGRAALASAGEKETYFEQQAIARKIAEKAALARRVQVAIIADPDLKETVSPKKGNDPVNGQ